MAVPVTDMIVSTAEDGVVAETTSIKDPNLAMAQSGVNNVLLEIISRFSGATYAGVATPETNPGTPILKVFYLTTTDGEYANFGNLTVESGKLTVLLYNGSTWQKQELDLPTPDPSFDLYGATYVGVASPDTVPETPTNKAFYLTTQEGTYTNFGNLTVESGKLTVLLYNGSTWQKQELDLPTPGGGSTVNVVQTTGTSTKDVMSQKSVTDELNEIRVNFESVFENKGTEERVVTAFQEGDDLGDPLFNSSTFSGAGMFLGKIPVFDKIVVWIKSADWVDGDNIVTKAVFEIRRDDKFGEILYRQIVECEISKGEISKVEMVAPARMRFDCNIFLGVKCDTYATLIRPYKSYYPFTPADGISYPHFSYYTLGNIDEDYTGSVSSTKDKYGAFAVVLTVLGDSYAINKEAKNEILCIDDSSISLPSKIYAVEGDTLQLFYRGILKIFDPYKYDILVKCEKGNQYPRYFEYTPKSTDVGETLFTIQVRDDACNVLAEKSCLLVTVPKGVSPSDSIKVLCFGDSLTAGGEWPFEAYRRLTASNGSPLGDGLTNISFCGSLNNNGAGYFGVGGWHWKTYIEQGKPAYRFSVSQVSSVSVGAVYNVNGNTFTVKEVNISAGSGNILCNVNSLTPVPPASGTLSKYSGSGDNSISYSSVVEDAQNPLWDVENSRMSFIPYANEVSGGEIDVVYTLLSWNGLKASETDFTNIIDRMTTFVDTLHSEFPNAKLKIMGVEIPSVNGGMGSNYGATGAGYADSYGMLLTALNMNDAYQEFANRAEYSDFVEFVNVSAQFDSENNMQKKMVDVNTRNDEQESRDINGVHPALPGYYQIADVVYRNFIANFCQNEESI